MNLFTFLLTLELLPVSQVSCLPLGKPQSSRLNTPLFGATNRGNKSQPELRQTSSLMWMFTVQAHSLMRPTTIKLLIKPAQMATITT